MSVRACLGLGALAACLVSAGVRPEFEVASVKPTQPGDGRIILDSIPVAGGPGTSDPGRWSCMSCRLATLVGRAYKIFEYQLIAPEWARNTGFDVIAKLPPGATADEFQLMQQNLLEDRFKMTVHREGREMPVYELVIAKNGPKLQEVGAPAPAPPPGPVLDKDGFPIVPGGDGMRLLNGRGRIQFRAQTMANVAHFLSTQVGRPVLDATGLKDKYALTLSWYRDTAPPATAAALDTVPGPTIFEAIQDQLGLKLEPKRGTIEVLVIDHAEKIPIAN